MEVHYLRGARDTVRHTPWLQSQLEIWKHKVCEFHDLAGSFSTTFNDENYRYILYGMQHRPALTAQVDAQSTAALFDELRRRSDRVLAQTTPHGDYLRQLNL